jgi:hypothetical protein
MGSTFSGYSNDEVIDFFNPFGNKQATTLAKGQTEEGQKRYDENMAKLTGLITDYQKQSDTANTSIESLYGNTPDLNLSKYSGELGKTKSATESGVNKYLQQGDQYISSSLKESTGGADNYLNTYKNLSQSEMPGLDIYKSQAGTNLASNVSTLKSMGGASSNSLATLMQGNQNNSLNIALQAGQYKTNSQKDLANAYLTSGQTKSTAYSNAASQTQNQAGIKQSLGSYSAGVTDQQAGYATQEYGADSANWQNQLQWRQTQAQMYDPLSYASNVYGNAAGIGWSQYQGGVSAQSQTLNATQQNNVNAASSVAKLMAK